jgi:hypothetical protein
MKIIISKIVFLTLCFLYTNNLSAQNGLNSGGGDASSDTNKISYSIGEVNYSAISQSTYYVTQGAQHPTLTILNPTFAEDFKNLQLNIKVYPNPVNADVHLEFSLPDVTEVKVRIFDMNGKLCMDKAIHKNENRISLKEFQPGIYILRLFSDDIEIHNSKIIKK